MIALVLAIATATAVAGTVLLVFLQQSQTYDDLVSKTALRTGLQTGSALITGDVETGANMVARDARVAHEAQIGNLYLTGRWSGKPDANLSGNSEISNDTSGFKALMLVGNRSAGAERRVAVWDKLNVHGTAEVSGRMTANEVQAGPGLYLTGGWSGKPDNGNMGNAEVANDTGGFKTLMLVGNRSAGAERRVAVWDRLNVHGTLEADGDVTSFNGRLRGRVDVPRGDGPMIERNYGQPADAYGIGQFSNGRMRMYTASAYGPATVGLATIGRDGQPVDALVVDNSRAVQILGDARCAGDMRVAKGRKLCVGDTCISEQDLDVMRRVATDAAQPRYIR